MRPALALLQYSHWFRPADDKPRRPLHMFCPANENEVRCLKAADDGVQIIVQVMVVGVGLGPHRDIHVQKEAPLVRWQGAEIFSQMLKVLLQFLLFWIRIFIPARQDRDDAVELTVDILAQQIQALTLENEESQAAVQKSLNNITPFP